MNLDHLRRSSRHFIRRHQLALAILVANGGLRIERTALIIYERPTLGAVKSLRHYWAYYTPRQKAVDY